MQIDVGVDFHAHHRTTTAFLVCETSVLDKKDQPAYADNKDWRAEFSQD